MAVPECPEDQLHNSFDSCTEQEKHLAHTGGPPVYIRNLRLAGPLECDTCMEHKDGGVWCTMWEDEVRIERCWGCMEKLTNVCDTARIYWRHHMKNP